MVTLPTITYAFYDLTSLLESYKAHQRFSNCNTKSIFCYLKNVKHIFIWNQVAKEESIQTPNDGSAAKE